MSIVNLLDALIGGIRKVYQGGEEKVFKPAWDLTDLAVEVLSDRLRLTVSGLRAIPIEDVTPTTGQVLAFDGTNWTPTAAASASSLLVANTVFVDGTNGTASGTRGDAAAPFDTIAHGLAAMASGDTLRVRPGTYSSASAYTLPDLAVVHVVLEPGVVVTSSASATFVRSSATALTTFTLDGGGGTIANTHATGKCFAIDGSSVTTPGYAVGTGKIEIRNVRIAPNDSEQTCLSLVCAGNVFLEDVRCAGKITCAEIGNLVARNVDQLLAAESTLTVGFDVGGTLPDGFAGPGDARFYSLKSGAVSLTGSLDATFDASCELASLASTRSAGALETGYVQIDGNLTLTESGTATNAIEGTVEGNVTAASDLDFTGLIRGDLTATAGTSTVRGTIVGTASEAGGTLDATYTFESIDGRVTSVEGTSGPPAKYAAAGTYSGSATSATLVTGCTVTPAAGTYAAFVGASGTNSGDAGQTIYCQIQKNATGASVYCQQAIGVWNHAGNCVVVCNGTDTVNVKAWGSNGDAYAVTQCELLLIKVEA